MVRTTSLAAFVALAALVAVWAQTAASPATAAPAETVETAPAGGPEQPIPFSHKVHAGTLHLQCEFCHAVSKSGATLVIPQAALCMQCHQSIAAGVPGVQKLADYAKMNRIIPWVRIYQLPSFVIFSHKIHLAHGNICQECHGQVAEQVQLSKEGDISMAGCLNCHREKKASIDCYACHMLEQ